MNAESCYVKLLTTGMPNLEVNSLMVAPVGDGCVEDAPHFETHL